MDLALSKMRLGDATYFVAIVRDITNRKAQTAALSTGPCNDALTDLPNRTLLNDRLGQAILTAQRQERQLALLIMDLNRFKEINDTLGHHIGDLVLQEVAKRMRAVLREWIRWHASAAHEFAVLLPETDTRKPWWRRPRSSKGWKRLSPGGAYPGTSAPASASPFSRSTRRRRILMQHADVAMYTPNAAAYGYALYEMQQDQASLRHLAMAGRAAAMPSNTDHCCCPTSPESISPAAASTAWKHWCAGTSAVWADAAGTSSFRLAAETG